MPTLGGRRPIRRFSRVLARRWGIQSEHRMLQFKRRRLLVLPRRPFRQQFGRSAKCLIPVSELDADLGNGLATSQECIEYLRIKMRAAAFFHDLKTPV